eukprot:NODE_364_length_8749_cov_0.472254.p2 type:complete len:538 gc:universal NODE_364_length_8749_cov_0.472254:1145-2758(+)
MIEIKSTSETKQVEAQILTQECLEFLTHLQKTFNPIRLELLKARQAKFDKHPNLQFLPETEYIRKGTWKCAPPAPGLVDRRVEITGPVNRKMVINALNSGATQFMADFEDATSPKWINIIEGQLNLHDAVFKRITVQDKGKSYKLNDKIATLLVRPRGLHMSETHLVIDGRPMSASLFDFGVYFFHNAHQLVQNGAGPYFYCPKLEHHFEAQWWNDVFNVSQDLLKIPRGTIRATVLIETIHAAYQMEEILYQLKDHSSGLNCGRWDYIFSVMKYFRNDPAYILPNRDQVTMGVPFMKAYVDLLIQICHNRQVHAMGGMAAHIPVKDNDALHQKNLDKVFQDKTREVLAGHDGTWVAHPALVKIAKDVFDEKMPTPHQLHKRTVATVKESDLVNMNIANGEITMEGVKENVFVCLSYMSAWIAGRGAVPIHHLMEDAATCEISRSQLWMWVRHHVSTKEGTLVSKTLADQLIDQVFSEIPGCDVKAKELLKAMTTGQEGIVNVKGCNLKEMVGYPLFVTDVMHLELEPVNEIHVSKL